MTKMNITSVVQSKLCNSCGACYAVCKLEAIEFRETTAGYYFPYVDENSCAICGLCFSVCPGLHFSNSLKNKISGDPFSGQCLDAFVGKATNKKVYENSQSGGIVSALAINSLESNLADAIVTVMMNWGNPSRPKVFLARSPKEIVLSQKSKYCPVPTLTVLKDVIGSKERIIFVGTSCQVHGLFNIMDKIPKLKDNIGLIIGLVCDRVMTYAALDYLVCQAKRVDVKDHLLTFRDKSCGGYPGNVHVKFVGGKSKVMPASARMRIKDYFTPARCRICFDKMNIFADITVGDPHGLEVVDRRFGESMIVVRTRTGQAAIQSVLKRNGINIRPAQYQEVLNGQYINEKRKQWSNYTEAWKHTGRDLPDYCDLVLNYAPASSKGKKYMQNIMYALNMDNISSRSSLIKFVEKALIRETILRRLLFPVRLGKRVAKKILPKLKYLTK